MGLFSSAPQALVGIDIGSDSIKAVELAGSYRSGFRLVHMGVAPSPPVAMRDGVPTAPEELGSHVRALLDRTGIKMDRAVMGVGGQAVTVREIRVPPMTKQELAAAVRYEAERYLPYNIKEVYMDFQVLGETTEDGRRMLDVIVVAARQDVVDQIIAVAEAARVQLRVLDVESFALLRSVIAAAGDGQTTAIVDLGAEASDILITEGQRLRFTRNIPIGGGVLLAAIHEAMDVDLATAKSLLEEKGEVLEEGATSPDHTTERIHDIIAPHIGDLVTEIRRSLDYYQTRSRAAVVNQILLAGGLARLRNLDRTIASELGIATAVASPFVNVRVNPQAFPADRLAADSRMAVAVGLAMRGGDVS
ncbi:MAG: type IV pilus assembly protein PilM [Armatimonadota bacterium]|nr:type IV pilus assembly protein PilM [Armatimonadota bacterium]MDR7519429.1 type IV pilus assembly protein PilM [Armatimonadota bacterium]MDR7549867.1 type IV pilus assembly protein PilM [Armatimonadota bacterium]